MTIKDKLSAMKAYLADKWKRMASFFLGLKSRFDSPQTVSLGAVEDFSLWLHRAADACSLLPCEDEELGKVDWAVRDVMVGAVRMEEQLIFNLQKCGYYVPARLIPEEQPPIKYIALHEEDVGGEPGIKRYGEVLTAAIVKRGGISVTMRENTDPNERYVYFKVRRWHDLPQAIAIQDSFKGRPKFTTKFLLDHCRKSYQLFAVSSEEDYRLMTEIHKAFENLPASVSAGPAVYRVNEHRCFFISEGFLTVTNDNGDVLDKISIRSFAESPCSGFKRIKKVVMDL